MRSLFRSLILANTDLTDKIPEDNWKTSGSLTEDNLPERPFAVIRFGVATRGMATIKRGSATIWVHDVLGTYTNIDSILDLLHGTLDGVEQVSDEAGNELISCEWDSTSGDLYDPGFRTITKNMTFNLIGKGV
jgi:hypothetical protein